MVASQPSLSKSDRTRETVLDAAEELFSERGFDATPLSAIGERVGIQASAILYHYPSKRDLYEAVLERMFTPLLDTVGLLLDGDGPLPDRLAEMAAAMVRFAAGRPAAARLVLREASAADEGGDIVGTASQREWARFARALAKEEDVDFDPLAVWNIVVGAISFYFGAGQSVGGLTHDPCDPARVAEFEARMIHLTEALCRFPHGARPDAGRPLAGEELR